MSMGGNAAEDSVTGVGGPFQVCLLLYYYSQINYPLQSAINYILCTFGMALQFTQK